MAADYCCKNVQELDDDVHRLLPTEILKDIVITDPEELRRMAMVEELASRLATVVLGDTVKRFQSQQQPRLYSPAWAANSSSHHHRAGPQPQLVVCRADAQGRRVAADHGNHAGAMRAQVWPPMAMNNGIIIILDMATGLPRFAPVAPRPRQVLHGEPPAPAKLMMGNRGTGVFLPRAEAHHHHRHHTTTGRGTTTKPPRNGKQQFQQQFHPHAHHAVQQLARISRSDANAASYYGLPQEWIY